VGKTDFDAPIGEFELYNLRKDPGEQVNLLMQHKEKATVLKKEMDGYINELGRSKNLVNPPRISVGTPHENPVYLNRNDAGGERGVWSQENIFSYWKVALEEGEYNLKFKFVKPIPQGGKMSLELGQRIHQKNNVQEAVDELEWQNISLPQGSFDFTPFYSKGRSRYFPFWVQITRVN
jgi:arylsulfatase